MIKDCERCGYPFGAHPATETLCRICKGAPSLREPASPKPQEDPVVERHCAKEGCNKKFELKPKQGRRQFCDEHYVGGLKARNNRRKKEGPPRPAPTPKPRPKAQPHGPAAEAARPRTTTDDGFGALLRAFNSGVFSSITAVTTENVWVSFNTDSGTCVVGGKDPHE